MIIKSIAHIIYLVLAADHLGHAKHLSIIEFGYVYVFYFMAILAVDYRNFIFIINWYCGSFTTFRTYYFFRFNFGLCRCWFELVISSAITLIRPLPFFGSCSTVFCSFIILPLNKKWKTDLSLLTFAQNLSRTTDTFSWDVIGSWFAFRRAGRLYRTFLYKIN